MQPIGTILTILVEDHPGIIPIEFGQIPIRCYIPNMKALGLVVSDKKMLKIAFWKPIFWPCDLLMQPMEWFEQLWYGTTQASYLRSLVKIQWARDKNVLTHL